MQSHACNAYCNPPEHCDLVYTSEAPVLAAKALVADVYRRTLGLVVTRLELAREAPELEALPAGDVLNLTPHHPPQGARRWLVFWSAC
jgi:hypothetical protein